MQDWISINTRRIQKEYIEELFETLRVLFGDTIIDKNHEILLKKRLKWVLLEECNKKFLILKPENELIQCHKITNKLLFC